MDNSKPFHRLVVPDDEPVVLADTPFEARARNLADEVIWHFDRPGDEASTIERLSDADCIINIRSSVKFTREVLAHCTQLRILSVWGWNWLSIEQILESGGNFARKNLD